MVAPTRLEHCRVRILLQGDRAAASELDHHRNLSGIRLGPRTLSLRQRTAQVFPVATRWRNTLFHRRRISHQRSPSEVLPRRLASVGHHSRSRALLRDQHDGNLTPDTSTGRSVESFNTFASHHIYSATFEVIHPAM